MAEHTSGTFDLTSWDEQSYDEQEGAKLGRVHSSKEFHGGIEGTSVVEILQAIAQQSSAAYVAIERVTGAVDGRTGSFVLRHSAVGTAEGASMLVDVVPDSGTSDLTGLRGEMRIANDDGAHSFEFDYELG